MSGKPADPAALWDYPLRAHVIVPGRPDPAVIGFPDWEAVADWLVSPGRWALGEPEAITITGTLASSS